MSNYTVTVIKSGNSYALRVPKALVDDKGLKLGQKIQLPGDVVTKSGQKYDNAKFINAVKVLQELQSFKDIKDPVAWQREIRKDRPLPGHDNQ